MRRTITLAKRALNTATSVPLARPSIAAARRVITRTVSTTSSSSIFTHGARRVAVAGMVTAVALTAAVVHADASKKPADSSKPKEVTVEELKAAAVARVAELRIKAKSGKAADLRDLGMALGQVGETKESLELLHKASEAGDAQASNILADLYHGGMEAIGVIADQVKAQMYWKRAIDLGSAEAMRDYGAAKLTGAQGIEKNTVEGLAFITRAAEAKDAPSAFMLYYINNAGEIIPRNSDQAIKWLNAAADLDHTLAHVEIACRTLGHLKEIRTTPGAAAAAKMSAADENAAYTQAQARLERVMYISTVRSSADDMGDIMGQCIAVYLLGALAKNSYGIVPESTIRSGDATEAIKQGADMQRMAVDYAREANMELPQEVMTMIPERSAKEIAAVAAKAKADFIAANGGKPRQ